MDRFWARLDKVLNIKEDDDSSYVLRCRALGILCSVLMCATIIMTILGFITEGMSAKRLLGPAVLVFYLFALWYLINKRSIVVPASILIACNGLAEVAYIMTSGGLGGYASPILVSVPLIAALLLGTRAAALISAIGVVIVWTIFGLAASGIYQSGPADPFLLSRAVIFTIVLVAVAILSMAFSEMNRQMRRDVERARDAALSAAEAKSTFLATMSHEIRTPMNGVIGMAELLTETDLDRRQRELAKIILSSGSALLTVINDVLDFSKFEAGKVSIHPAPMNLRTAIEDVASLMSVRAKEKDIELAVDYDPALPEGIIADSGRLRQVLTNLAGNAVKFTDRGHVIIRVRPGPTREDAKGTQHFLIDVEDTGCGIDEEDQTRLFEKFEQAFVSDEHSRSGTGLGLAIAKGLVELMHGTISLRSRRGAGSTFTISVTFPTDETVASSGYLQAPELQGVKMLVVDDNSVSRDIIATQAKAWGVEIEAANGAHAALAALHAAKAAKSSFDLLVTDLHLPDDTGLGLAQKVRQVSDFTDMPIIALSSVSQDETPVVDTISGRAIFDGHLTKPVRGSELMDSIATALYERSARDAQATLHQLDPEHVISETPPTDDSPSEYPLVLLIEDNVVNQMVFTSMLKTYPVRVVVANDGVEGVSMAMDLIPDLVVSDISMPRMDGFEVARRLRAWEGECRVGEAPLKLIALTAHVLEEERERCAAAGFWDFVAKPLRREAVAEMLSKHLGPDSVTQKTAMAGVHSNDQPCEESGVSPRSSVG